MNEPLYKVGETVYCRCYGVRSVRKSVITKIHTEVWLEHDLEMQGEQEDLIDCGGGYYRFAHWDRKSRVKGDRKVYRYDLSTGAGGLARQSEDSLSREAPEGPAVEVLAVVGNRRWVRVNGTDLVEDVE